tara:strand:- start:619 stop:1962 length:1344 start_codon:yes stop_codon:yes gene_type:complete
MGVSSDAALPDGTFANDANAINVILTQEANRISNDIHKATLHTSPWIDLIKKGAFPDGMGYTLNTLVYDRALPLKSGSLSSTPVLGLNWNDVRLSTLSSGVTGFTDGQSRDHTGVTDEGTANIDFTQELKSYSLKKATVESPRVNVEDLRFAAHRNDQLRAIMDLLQESVRHSWEERYRDEYDRLADNTVLCKSDSSTFIADVEGKQSFAAAGSTDSSLVSTTQADGTDIDAANDGQADLTANISNAIMDKIYYKLVRAGAGGKAYGRENGRPIFSVVMSSEASYQLQTEAGFRDDVRYNNAKVGDLIAPLGVEKSFRGFYHLVDDLTTRYTDNGNVLSRVEPFTVTGAVVVPNPLYESAKYEAAYILVDDVMESLIPQPLTGGGGVTFDPVKYSGDFKWTNIPDAAINPDGTIGFFRGIMASASKPIKTSFGYVVLFKRTSTTPAA